VFSASDVSNFLSCHHLLTLDGAQAAGAIKKPFFHDPGIDLLRELGDKHERAYLRYLATQGLKIVEISTVVSEGEAVGRTLDAMCSGIDVIYQATFKIGLWHGRPDFLLRVQKPSSFGKWSYEPLETKLARSTKAGALIQLCFYSDLLSQIQNVQPDWMHIVLGGNAKPERYPVEQYIAYFRKIKQDFDAACKKPSTTYPEPTEHCNVCTWDPVCDSKRRNDDHLSMVAGITRNQRKALALREVTTVAELSRLDLATIPKIDGIGRQALVRIQQQAHLQVEGREAGHLVYELLEANEPNRGLSALPVPSNGDIFLDLEGEPYVFEQELEYLIGVLTLDESIDRKFSYQPLWSFDKTEEKKAFTQFMVMTMERWSRYPDMHIYHYAAYEPTAIKRLAGQHGVFIDEVDQLLRAGIFVDLYRVVRQGVKASVESYSIKKLEPLYDFVRSVPPRVSVLALQTFGVALAMGNAREAASGLLPALESYNRDDCLSAWQLRGWLEDRRSELETKTNKLISRPSLNRGEATEDLTAQTQKVRAVISTLVATVPTQEANWTSEHRGLWLLAQMLEYHRREAKSAWWEYFKQCEYSDDELLEDRNALGGLTYVGQIDQVKRSTIHRYSFPPQDHTIDRANAVHDPKTKKSAGTVVRIDDHNGTVDIKRSTSSAVPHPAALVPQNIVGAEAQRDSLLRVGTWVAEHGINGAGPFQAARDLLLRRPPRVPLANLGSLFDENEQWPDTSRELMSSLCAEPSVLPVQGPPGSGKTYTGARMIVELVRNGRRVGITAVSHKVVSKLLQETCKAARKENVPFRAVQKANEVDGCTDPMVIQTEENNEVLDALTSGAAQLGAGTSWLWAREDMLNSVDVLFVDEAGQMSLADVIAISQASKSIVLLGDPQQLNQPQKGVHPPGVEVSALAHLLDGRATIEEGRGLFLNETWRLHPSICSFISELFYDSKLAARPENQNQRLLADGFLDDSGLRFVPVEHTGNQSESLEEVEKIVELVNSLLGGKAAWINKADEIHTLELDDILIVAPYNSQVSALSQKLPVGARVGTVDKFQGQEAPVVFYSMTTSTPEDAPRGMEFLYSLNRLNVAISRARCIAVIVASPALFQAECKTPRQVQLVNALCRYCEMAPVI
jgi:predicted RecB family nuclease